MTREEFSTLVKAMKAVYTDVKFIPDKDAFDVWYAMLNDIEYKQMSLAVQAYIQTEKFPPSVADLRSKCLKFVPDNSINEMQAWSMVSKAIRDSAYHALERFNELPQLVQKAVGSPENLRNWGLSDMGSVETVIQSNFIKTYRTILQRENEIMKLSDSARKVIETINSADTNKLLGDSENGVTTV